MTEAEKTKKTKRAADYRLAGFEFGVLYAPSIHVNVMWLPGLSADEIAKLFIDAAKARGWHRSFVSARACRWIQADPPLANVKPLIWGKN